MIGNLGKVGGRVVESEDEIGGGRMCMGGNYGGVGGFSGSGGGGLCVMME